MAEQLADHDDDLLARLVAGATPDRGELLSRLAALTASGRAFPLVFGSARGGQGVTDLIGAVRDLLPAATGDDGAELRGTVFALERDGRGAKAAYVRLFDGSLGARERVRAAGSRPTGPPPSTPGRSSSLEVVGPQAPDRLAAGHIGIVKGLPSIRVGDWIGRPDKRVGDGYFARPTLESLVRAGTPKDTNRLHEGLYGWPTDPLISTRAVAGGRTSVMLYGEIQKEIIAETLARDFGVEAVFEPSQTVHLERPVGRGSAVVPMAARPSWPVSDCGSRPERRRAGSPTGGRLNSGRCHGPSTWRSRRPPAGPWARGCGAGR